MAAVRRLRFVMLVLGRPTNGIGGFYHCAKSVSNRYSNFDNMHVLNFAS